MIIPMVIAAVVLGKAFDIQSLQPSNYFIFDQNEIEDSKIMINRTFTQSQYRLVESSSDVNDFLNIDGELSLKVKAGKIGLQGSGSYLTKTVNRQNTVEMLITVNHETRTLTFPSYVKQREDWKKRPQGDVGTHYIRSITYGGQLIVSYKLKATKSEYMEEIKGAVTANLAMSGSLDVNVTGNLEKLSKAVAGKAELSISATATCGVFSPPQNIDDLYELVDSYPKKVEEIGGGLGAPLKIELVDLSTLKPDYKAFMKNFALDGVLSDATNRYDDLRSAKASYMAWQDTYPDLNQTEEEWDDAYNRRLSIALNEMTKAITNLDASKGLDQFDNAFKAYGEGGENIPDRYSRDLNDLIHKVNDSPFYWFPYTKAVTHYIRWGNISCSLPNTEPLFKGYAATSPKGWGNGGNVQCLPANKPAVEEKQISSGTVTSQMNGLMYELPDKTTGQVFCAYCKLENATAAYVIASRTNCPAQMKLEYSGWLMTNRDAGTASSFTCLDKNPVQAIPDQDPTGQDKNSGTLIPVWTICKGCDEDEKQKFVSCVVCSR